MAERQSRYCTKAGCGLHNITVDTEKKECISCGTELRIDFMADTARMFTEMGEKFKR